MIYIDHHKSERLIKDIAAKKQKKPFQHFVGSKWVLYDTDDLVKALWNFYFPNNDYLNPESAIDNKLWKKYVDEWCSETEEKYGMDAKCGIVGEILFKISEYETAVDFYEQALNLAREIGDKQSEGRWLGNLGNTHYFLGNYQKAIDYYQSALNIAKEIGDKQGEGSWLGNLGLAYDSLSDHPKAIGYDEQALDLAREIGDKRAEGAWLGGLGNSYVYLGDHPKAIGYYE